MKTFDEFELTENHIKLLKNMHVSWNHAENGAPTIDPKRPYGNYHYLHDMIKVLDLSVKTNCDGYYLVNEKLSKRLSKLHEELETALQIVLVTGSFKTGVYRREKFNSTWIRISNIGE